MAYCKLQLLEFSAASQDCHDVDYNELRRQLELPEHHDIEVESGEARNVPLSRLSRVDATKLTDDDLVSCFARAGRANASMALCRLAKEIVGRKSLADRSERVEAHANLGRLSADREVAWDHFRKARELSIERGDSPASLMLAELSLRLEHGVLDGCQSLIDQIQANHLKEPGVAQEFIEVLKRFGLVKTD